MPDLADVKEIAAAADFFAVLATARSDGTVHAPLVKAGLIYNPDTGQASVGVVVGRAARKVDHLRASGQATIVFAQAGRWVAVEGPAQVVGPHDGAEQRAAAILRSVYIAAGGIHDDWDEFDRVMAEAGRCVVLVAARRIASN
jgi:hypothetical protein